MRKINKILICDDHDIYRSGLELFAKEYFNNDIQVLQADAGDKAWNLFKTHAPEVVFLDIEMPVENGISVCKKIKELSPKTLVLIISMHTEKIIYGAVKKANANGYITKGDSNEQIAKCLDVIQKTGIFYSPLSKQFTSESEALEFEKIIDQLNDLTNTERKVLNLVLSSKTSEEIADILFVSTKSVNNYRNRVCRKLDLPPKNNALNIWLLKNQSALKVFYS